MATTISFDEIPYDWLKPGTLVEVKPNYDRMGKVAYPARTLLIVQKLAAGSAVALQQYRITRPDQGRALFGAGSVGADMVEAYKLANKTGDLFAIGVADAAAGVAATGSFTFAGSGAGALALYVGTQRIPLAVTSGMTAAQIATAAAAAINAIATLPVTAAAAPRLHYHRQAQGRGGQRAQARGGEADRRHGADGPYGHGRRHVGRRHQSGYRAGAGRHRRAVVHRHRGAVGRFHHAHHGRREPCRPLPGHGQEGWSPLCRPRRHLRGAHHQGRSHQRSADLGHGGEGLALAAVGMAATLAGICEFQLTNDPARQLRGLTLPGIEGPAEADRFTETEQDLLLKGGISTFTVSDDGTVSIDRVVTTYKVSPLAVTDRAWLDIMVPKTMSRLRYDWASYVSLLYPRNKLAQDGSIAAEADQSGVVVTPMRMHGSWSARCQQYERWGWIQNSKETVRQSVFAIDDSDGNRLNARQQVRIIGNLMVLASSLEFQV